MGKLNVNFAKNIGKFESAMKHRFLIKSVFYKKMLMGKGLEFDAPRKYTESDDASLIDWKISLRIQQVVVKRYLEERDLKVFFIIDVGDNMVLGSGNYLKNEIAAEIAASLAHLAIVNGNSVGFSLYSENIKIKREFSSGVKQFYIFGSNLKDSKNYGGKSNLGKTLELILPYMKEATVIFIISDFIKMGEECSDILRNFASKYETVGIMVRDRIDEELPDLKREFVIEDTHTSRQLLINPGLIRHEYRKHALAQRRKIEGIFKKAGADLLNIYTDKDFIIPLSQFLKLRTKTGRYVAPRR